MPLPKKPDNTEYEASLSHREKDIYTLYKEIEDNRDESKLVSLVKQGTIKPDTTNKEGQTPLMFAVDSSFSDETINKLIDLGCDVNQQN